MTFSQAAKIVYASQVWEAAIDVRQAKAAAVRAGGQGMTPPVFLTRPPMTLPVFPDTLGARTLAEVAGDYGVTVADILGKSRVRHIARARQATCRRLRRDGWSFERIGRRLNIHHTTAMYACKVAA